MGAAAAQQHLHSSPLGVPAEYVCNGRQQFQNSDGQGSQGSQVIQGGATTQASGNRVNCAQRTPIMAELQLGKHSAARSLASTPDVACRVCHRAVAASPLCCYVLAAAVGITCAAAWGEQPGCLATDTGWLLVSYLRLGGAPLQARMLGLDDIFTASSFLTQLQQVQRLSLPQMHCGLLELETYCTRPGPCRPACSTCSN